MLDNLTLLAAVIIVFWLGILAFYFLTSRQQTKLQDEIESLEKLLDKIEKETEGS